MRSADDTKKITLVNILMLLECTSRTADRKQQQLSLEKGAKYVQSY